MSWIFKNNYLLLNGLLLAGFVLFTLGYWMMKAPESPSKVISAQAIPVSSNAQPASAELATAENVDHQIHLQIFALKEHLADAPADTVKLSQLARLLHDAHQFQEAALYYNRLLEHNPENTQGWLDLANVYAALNDWEGAIHASKSLLAVRPDNPSAMYNLGAIYANQSQMNEAISWWVKVRDQQSNPALSIQAGENLRKVGWGEN